MKKYIILLLPILVLCFGTISSAVTIGEVHVNKLKEDFHTRFNKNLSDVQATQILTKWQETGYKYCFIFCNNDSSYNMRCDFSNTYTGEYRVTAPYVGSGVNGGGYVTSGTNMSWSAWKSFSSGYDDFYSTYSWCIYKEDYLFPDIDWTNLTYDPTIPTPEIRYVIDTSGVYSSHDGPNGIVIDDTIPYSLYLNSVPGENNGSDDDLYVYVTTKFWYPIEGQLERKGGFDYFTADRFVKSDYLDMIAFNELHNAPRGAGSRRYDLDSDSSYGLLTKWHNFYTNALVDNGGDLTLSYKGYSTDNQKNQAKWNTKQYLHNAGIYGNRIMIFVCYFQIKEEKVYVSNFAKWYSTQPDVSTTEALSQLIYSDGEDASGVSSVVTEEQFTEEEQNSSNNPPLNITDYGTSVTVNNNMGQQYVPNNQSYPTVVSYNHDNLFTQFVSTYQSAGQYLGDFGNFVQATFAWIPGQVWTLIIMGFGMALVIMILKII